MMLSQKITRAPFRLHKVYDRYLKAHPIKTKMVTLFFIAGAADIVSQIIGKKTKDSI